MIERSELPEDVEDWKDVEVDFPRLSPDSPENCPATESEIMEYVRMESADLDDASQESLVFVRTALVGEDECWLWTYTESDGQIAYVTYRRRSQAPEVLGLTDANGLSPEQFMLAEYYDEVYW